LISNVLVMVAYFVLFANGTQPPGGPEIQDVDEKSNCGAREVWRIERAGR